MIVGGGAIAFYLSQYLLENKIKVRIIERDLARCDYLAEELPEAQVLCEDGSNRSFLLSEGLGSAEAFVALTNMDEENILLSLFASNHSQAKRVTKINRLEFDEILGQLRPGQRHLPQVHDLRLHRPVRPRAAERGRQPTSRPSTASWTTGSRRWSSPSTRVSPATGIPLSELHLKPNLLLCCITRGDQIIIPRGGDTIQLGDTVIVVHPAARPCMTCGIIVAGREARANELRHRFPSFGVHPPVRGRPHGPARPGQRDLRRVEHPVGVPVHHCPVLCDWRRADPHQTPQQDLLPAGGLRHRRPDLDPHQCDGGGALRPVGGHP